MTADETEIQALKIEIDIIKGFHDVAVAERNLEIRKVDRMTAKIKTLQQTTQELRARCDVMVRASIMDIKHSVSDIYYAPYSDLVDEGLAPTPIKDDS